MYCGYSDCVLDLYCNVKKDVFQFFFFIFFFVLFFSSVVVNLREIITGSANLVIICIEGGKKSF